MIEFPRDPQNTIPSSSVKIVGLGGAGTNMLDRVVLDGMDGAEMLAVNTDIRTLSGSVARERIQLGRNLTKGLGCGGDPELGQQAILEAEAEIRAALKGRKIVFLCVGLGGGTGSGAAPIICRIAREEGAFVVVFATMPFSFEGRRRRDQADTALNELAVLSNALVTFDNTRMGDLVLAKQGIHEAFAAADRMISESIKAVIRLVIRPGLINVGLDDLMTALRTTRSRCLFGSGIASGKDRAQKALRNALNSPLLDQGALLRDAESVLVHLCGGQDLTLYEIELLMQSLSKHVPDKAHVLFGAAVDPSMGESLSITMVSSLPEDRLHAPRTASMERPALLEPTVGFAGDEEEEEEPVAVAPPPVREPVREPVSEVVREREPVREPVRGVEPAPIKKAAPPASVAKAIAAASLFDETKPVVAEFNSKPKPAPAPVEEEEMPFAEPEPSAFTIDRNSSNEISNDDDFAGKVEEIVTLRSASEVEAEDEFPEMPDLDDAPEEESPAFFTIDEEEATPEEEPESEPVAAAAKDAKPVVLPGVFDELDDVFAGMEDVSAAETPVVPAKARGGKGQSELSFEGGPRGKFEGASPSLFEGEDLDVPAFLRKKR
jgi:cell division protein FtsZ